MPKKILPDFNWQLILESLLIYFDISECFIKIFILLFILLFLR